MAVSTIGGNILAAAVLTASLTPASVAANTSAAQTFTVPGVKAGDFVSVSPPGLTAGTIAGPVRVTASDTVSIVFGNFTAGALTPAAGAHTFLAVRPESGTFTSFSA